MAGVPAVRCCLVFVHDGVRLDVDLGTSKLRRQASVLAFLTDCQRELVVGNEGTNSLGSCIENECVRHLGRRESVRDEGGKVSGEVNDVDLFLVELLGDGTNAASELTNTRTLALIAGSVAFTAILVR